MEINFDLVRLEKTCEYLTHKVEHLEGLIKRLIEAHPRLALELQQEQDAKDAETYRNMQAAGLFDALKPKYQKGKES